MAVYRPTSGSWTDCADSTDFRLNILQVVPANDLYLSLAPPGDTSLKVIWGCSAFLNNIALLYLFNIHLEMLHV